METKNNNLGNNKLGVNKGVCVLHKVKCMMGRAGVGLNRWLLIFQIRSVR